MLSYKSLLTGLVALLSGPTGLSPGHILGLLEVDAQASLTRDSGMRPQILVLCLSSQMLLMHSQR